MAENTGLRSLIIDPTQVDPQVDVTGLRTATDTSPQLLAQAPDFQGVQFDPTSYDYISDLYELYTGGLPMLPETPTDPAQIPGAADTLVNVGDQSQGTGNLVQDLVPTEDEQVTTPITEPNVFEGSPFIETSPNVLSAVNAAGEPISGNIVDPATGDVYAPGDYSDVAGTLADPREKIDIVSPVSSTLPVSDQIDTQQDFGIFDPTPVEGGAGTIEQETFLPVDDFTPQTPPLDTAGTGDASIAEQIADEQRAAADIPEIGLDSEFIVPTEGVVPPQEFILPAQKPIDFSAIDAQTADELAQQFTPEQIQEAQDPENISLYNQVIQGAKSAGEFIADRGVDLYNLYNVIQGGFAGALGGLNLLGLNPLTGLIGATSEFISNTPSAQEYRSYSDEQRSEIDKAYGPGGVMQGYNPVSQFGEGVLATVEGRIQDRASLGIFDDTTEELNDLAEALGGNRIDAPAYDFDDVNEFGGIDLTPSPVTTTDPLYDFDDPEPAPAPAPSPPAYDFDDGGSDDSGGGGGGSSTAGDDPGYSGPSPFNKGGFVNAKR